MKKTYEKYITEYKKKNSQYPELDKIALKLANETIRKINKEAHQVKSEMPYKAQYILEEMIRHLEEAV
jgi:hypothetical protein